MGIKWNNLPDNSFILAMNSVAIDGSVGTSGKAVNMTPFGGGEKEKWECNYYLWGGGRRGQSHWS